MSILALTVAGALLPATPALAACSDNMPAQNSTVTCDTAAPNPDPNGIQSGGIASDRVTVNVLAGAGIHRTGSGEHGIRVGSSAVIDINGSVVTEGNSAYAIWTGANADITVRNGGLVAASGTPGNAIQMNTGTVVIEQGGLVMVSGGVNARGIVGSGTAADDMLTVTVAGTVEGSNGARGVEIGAYSRLDVTSTGIVRALHGTGGSHAITLTGSHNEVNLDGAVSAGGNSSYGLFAQGDDNIITLGVDGTIDTTGSGGRAIRVEGNGNEITVDGAITTVDLNGFGVEARGDDNTISVSGSIDTHGWFGQGIRVDDGSGNFVEFDGSIVTRGDSGYGIFIDEGGNSIEMNGGSITTSGLYGYGIAAFDDGNSIVMRAGTISTTGEQAAGIVVDSSTGDTIEIGGTVTVTGLNSHAVWGTTNAAQTTVIVSGTLSSAQGNAILLEGSNIPNLVELRQGYSITGNVAGAGSDTLALGGDTDASFDLSGLGVQFTGFSRMEKTGNSTWTVNNVPTAFTGVTRVSAGRLDVVGTLGTVDVVGSGILGGTGTLGAVQTQSPGGIISPGLAGSAGTLTMASLRLSPGAVLEYDLGAPGTIGGGVNDLIVVNGTVNPLYGTININDLPGFDAGTYTLMTYDAVAPAGNRGIVLGTAPTGYTYTLDIGATAMTLTVLGGGGPGWQYWDGAGAANGTVDGGSGNWDNTTNTNWVAADGTGNTVWGGGVAVFGGPAGGDVYIDDAIAFTGLRFETDGYSLFYSLGAISFTADAAGAEVYVADNVETLTGVTFLGGPITKTGDGTLTVAGTIVDNAALVETWTVEGGELVIDGRLIAGSWVDDTALIVRNGSMLTVTEFGSIDYTSGDPYGNATVEIVSQGHVVIEEGGFVNGGVIGGGLSRPVISNSTVAISGELAGLVRFLSGSDNRIEIGSTGSAYQVRLQNDRSVVVVEGRIENHFDGVPGIEALGANNKISVVAGGVVHTHGAVSVNRSSRGIYTYGAGNEVDVAGTVATEGQGMEAIFMGGSGAVLEISGTATSASPEARTVHFFGADNTMTLWGTVAAANAGATAILFENGSPTSSNTLELRPGYSITGLVVGDTVAAFNDLILGGSGSATFDLSSLGSTEQFRNFNRFSKDGDATWTLEGTHAYDAGVLATPFYFSGGTLLVNGELRLGSRLENNGVATLGGSGRIAALEATSGLTIAPGELALDGSSEIGTLRIDVVRFHNDTALNFDLGTPGVVGGADNDLIEVRYDLTLDGTLNVTDAGGFGNGEYTLITYGNLVANNGLDIGTMPDPDLTYVVSAGDVGTSGNVILTVSGGAAGDNQYWDGPSLIAGTVEGGDGVWNAANANWTDAGGGANDVWGGKFAIFRGAAGTVTVEGTQAFTGMQFLTSYGIVAGTGGELRPVLADTHLRIGAGMVAHIDAPITGTGGIVKQEAGGILLAGANTYSGATLVNGGILRANAVGTFSAASAHTVAAGAVLDLNDYDQTIASLAGEGSVRLGSATLTTGGNDAGTTFGGVIGGSGGLVKTGIGIMALTGENTYTGLTTIARGTLVLGDGGAGGSVAGNIFNDNNFLVFNRSDDFTYGGVLSGSGATSFVGAGMTTLSGDSGGLTGPVGVTAGNLRIGATGALGATLLTVGTDGALSGLGTVAGNVRVDGRLEPGADALGTLTVAGNVAFDAASTFAVRIAADGGNDALSATGATLDGQVTVTAVDAHTSYLDGQDYTILTTDAGGVSGAFDGATMTNHSAFLTPTLTHNADNVVLTIAVTRDFGTVAESFNQFQAAGALNGLEQTGDALLVFNTIANMDEDSARTAFDLSSGEVHAAGQHVVDQSFVLFNHTLRHQGAAGLGSGNVGSQVFTAPLGYGPAVAAGNAGVVAANDAVYADTRVRGAWAAPLGGFGHVDDDGNAARLGWWNAGLAGGYEGAIDTASGKAVGGFGFGYIHSRGTIDDRLSTFDSDGVYLGAYGAWTDGAWNVAGSLSYGAARVSTARDIAFMGRTAQASYWTHTVGLSGEAAYAFDLADTTRIAPLVTLDAGWSGHGGFAEIGAGALNLISGSQSWTRFDTGLGIALTHSIRTDSGRVTLEGRAVWEHAFADVVPGQSLALAGSPAGFTVLGPDAGRNRLRVGAGLSWEISDDMSVRARYDGLFSGKQASHSGFIGLNIRF